ncbi:MAG: NADH-quinone oxidoreductase subunit N [Acidimicrobiales bacterium]|nr:NADH-quinone oxidoreductase subunit N [Acidimicrobiales bacterium]
MTATLLAAAGTYSTPVLDWHALAPLVVLTVTLGLTVTLDAILAERSSALLPNLVGLGLLGSLIPTLTLAISDDRSREMLGGAFVVDRFALMMTALFVVAGYVTVLLSTHYVAEGDYAEGEYYFLLLASVIGMVFMASARDLVSIFVALELLSIPVYLLAGWRKRAKTGIEAGMKYYLIGVFASAVMLYGMSLIFGGTGETRLVEIGNAVNGSFGAEPVAVIGIVLTLVGFAFKVSAVPFHTWAPDTYEGAPTPVTAFLSVASKAAGFAALVTMVFLAFPGADGVYGPFLWVLAALTMTGGNVLALRQTNIVRMLAYSSVSQGGFILMPLAVMASGDAAESALKSVVIYLLIYAFSNLGAFAVIIAVSRKTRSGEISSFGGLMSYAPGMGLLMTIFLASLAGIPPLGIWIAQLQAFKTLLDAGDTAAYVLAVVAAVNTVISAAYYMKVLREMWMKPVPDGDTTPVVAPQPVWAALGICAAGTVVLGVLPSLVLRFADLPDLTSALGR